MIRLTRLDGGSLHIDPAAIVALTQLPPVPESILGTGHPRRTRVDWASRDDGHCEVVREDADEIRRLIDNAPRPELTALAAAAPNNIPDWFQEDKSPVPDFSLPEWPFPEGHRVEVERGRAFSMDVVRRGFLVDPTNYDMTDPSLPDEVNTVLRGYAAAARAVLDARAAYYREEARRRYFRWRWAFVGGLLEYAPTR